MGILFYFFVFPGFLFSSIIGLLTNWFDRKLTAKLQYRIGPRWYQSFIDIIKLFYKEVILPENTKVSFIVMPFLALISSILIATILGLSIKSGYSFSGDIIILAYLLLALSAFFILGASSSMNPLASIGASREMKLILAYELPFILSLITIIIKTKTLGLAYILEAQSNSTSNIFSLSGFLAFLVSFICIQAKMGFVPFDMAEAEQEIMGGIFIEYSGLLLVMYKLAKAILLYSLILFLIILFFGKDLSILFLSFKYLIITILIILVKNTNPRLRIDQALRFFWGPVTALATIAVILSLLGL